MTLTEYAECARCGEPILRFPGGAWEHAIDVKLDGDHFPEPELEPLTEEEAEKEWQTVPSREPPIPLDVKDGRRYWRQVVIWHDGRYV